MPIINSLYFISFILDPSEVRSESRVAGISSFNEKYSLRFPADSKDSTNGNYPQRACALRVIVVILSVIDPQRACTQRVIVVILSVINSQCACA